ncbi:MAG TPA: RsiV family protein [Paludibacter sp.]|nr:RsiV family protein [Paludibacter sp.]
MKRRTILFIFGALTVIFFNSCKQKTIKIVQNDCAQKYFLTSDTTKGSIIINIETEIPSDFMNDTILKTIRKTIVSGLYGKDYDTIPTDSLAKRYVAELIQEYKLNNEPLLEKMNKKGRYSFDNEHNLEGFSLLSDKIIFSYGISRYVFMGGAHGLNTRTFYNFDLKTGNKITENDIFVAGFEKPLIELIKTRIIEQSKEDPELQPIITLEETDFWVDAIKHNGNFYITDESINYVFNPYEIAPYYMGQTEVVLSFERLKNLLKKGNIISYLYEKKK